MTAARLFKTYKPLVAVMKDGFHCTQFIELASRPDPVMMSDLRNAIRREARENWLAAGLISVAKERNWRWVKATPKALDFLRCKTCADAAALLAHKRALHPEIAHKIKTFLTLLSIAVNGPDISINDAKEAAGLSVDGSNMITIRSWRDSGWITMRRESPHSSGKWLLTITPAGLQALGVTA